MFARLTSLQGSPDLEARIRLIKETLAPEASAIVGFAGGSWLIDRSTGRFLTITLWNSEDEMRASEARIATLREDAALEVGGELESIECFEVVQTLGR